MVENIQLRLDLGNIQRLNRRQSIFFDFRNYPWGCLFPNSKLPTRTWVLPSSTAIL